ncbi:HsdM family class I SAM-dependent methyltransferase [Lacrimispora sp.]|uniref:HsdM family class I SAM-dependent methyltransferase n=1 Tax=Lacrimispora sp. TaxID=2719234 RepID=UPI0028B1EDA5|nr:N-6 DNA methylase [Lacrimispora sp.]
MRSVNIRNMLSVLGYTREHFSENYHVQIDGTSAVCFDYVAFSDRYMKDVSTSCIAIQEVNNEQEQDYYVRNARYMATPVLIISNNSKVQVWNIAPNKQTLVTEEDEKVIHLYFEKNRFEFMSENLIEAKMGIRQITIFEAAGLINFSRNVTCKILSDEFTKGLVEGKAYIRNKKNINNHDMNNVTSITMHIISALIINSKINTKQDVPDVFELLSNLSNTYKEYFNDSLMFKYGKGLVKKIYESLNISINYQSVDHELLGYFYESTLLQLNEKKANSLRKEFGIYYTPKVLSQEIANHIPLENLPIYNRTVLDGTCGSGSLLLSACKRLENLVYYEMGGIERHDYLTKMITGYDLDKFASEVARLSLLLYSLPYGNRWNINAGDLLKHKISDENAPFIIIGNPPYEEKRGDSVKSQKATSFLDKYMDCLQEGGYLGIILPESFLQNDSSEIQRKRLLEDFDILELWSLPGGVFENNCATIVIIAQKRVVSENLVTKIKILTRNTKSIKRYFKSQQWDFIYFDNLQSKWKANSKNKMNFSPIDDIFEKIKKCELTLGDATDNIMGIMLPSYYDKFSRMNFDGWVPYIVNADNFQKYYMSEKMEDDIQYLNYEMAVKEEPELKKSYRGTRLRSSSRKFYNADSKVLIKMSSTPGTVECISAFVDNRKCYPSHSFFVMCSKDTTITNENICALINSKLINAYVRKECVKRTLTTGVVRNIPVPDFSKAQTQEISSLFEEIKKLYNTASFDSLHEIENKLNYLIYRAFHLTDDEIKRIEDYYNIYQGKFVDKVKTEQSMVQKFLNVSGEVININFANRVCGVDMVETGEMDIVFDDNMPGWFLREGAKFSAKFSNNVLYDIKPLVYSYLDDQDIISFFSNELSETKGE